MDKTYVHIAMDTIENSLCEFSLFISVALFFENFVWIKTMIAEIEKKLSLILITKERYDLVSFEDKIPIFKGDYTRVLIQTFWAALFPE